MMDPIIIAEGLGKKYKLGARSARNASLRDAIAGAASRLTRAVLRRAPIRSNPSGVAHSTASADSISKTDFWALRNVSFDIAPGDVVGIIGRNGAGKSTLLKILSRITRPTEGRARVRGSLASLLEVGTGFHGDLTGRENIFLNGSILGMSRRDIVARFDEIVAFADVAAFLDTPVKRYSSGMYVRLAFAVAAHLEPDILVIDEVLAVGDAEFQKKSLGKMREVGQDGRTVIFVSHNMNAIEQLCRSAILLDHGGIVRQGDDVRGIINQYLWNHNSELAVSEWTNNAKQLSNPWFTPTRFWIGDRDGSPSEMPLANNDDMWVHIEGTAEQLDDALTVGYALFDELGALMFWSYQTDRGQADRPMLRAGHNHLCAPIPRRLLNEGDYRVELIGSLHFREWLFEPAVSAPAIHLRIKGGLSDSPFWMIKRPGLLAPVIKWESA